MKPMNLTLAKLVGLIVLGALVPSLAEEPLVLGRGTDRFEVGELLHEDDFDSLERWEVQLEEKEGFPEPHILAREGVLDCFVPGRGATVWFKEKLKTRLAICYQVVCPEPEEGVRGVEVKDVNNFWLASDPEDPEEGLFDKSRYTGDFRTYNKMSGYYASTGGGRNTTTRMRRYPREREGQPVEHIALRDKDGQANYMIPPGKKMSVQLVAFDDLIQYIVDGELVYEIAFGDEVAVERVRRGQRVDGTDDYDDDEFPIHREGYFGFRMVGTHHIYSDFKVYSLEPKKVVREKVEVSSLEELREAAGRSHQDVVMADGTYTVKDISDRGVAFHFSGAGNVFDFSGVTFEVPLETLDQLAEVGRRSRRSTFFVTGNEVVIKGGTIINTYKNDPGEQIDFGSYNQDEDNFPAVGMTEMQIRGDDCKVIGTKLVVRGSYPYGYGNMYGIGSSPAVPLRKHNALLVKGDRVLIDGCEVRMEAFGHAIFVQGGDDILVKNCYVEGGVRPSNDFHEENDKGDLARKFDHEIQWPKEVKGLKVPRDHMINLVEDGIRAYGGTGRMVVEDCRVVRTRGGIKLYMAKEGIIRNSEVIDCVIQGFSVPSGGVIENCRGNAAYGPLLYIHMDHYRNQKVDIEVIPAPHGIGDHPLAALKGRDHSIIFTSAEGDGAQLERPIIVGYPLRFDYLSKNYPKVPKGMEKLFARYAPEKYQARRMEIVNRTKHPVVLSKLAEENEIFSLGPVRDLGQGNLVELAAGE
ncbi:MAG: right-handed parallel beta-helix repeat-containing protein [Verrucomicrobiota bacterium JB023]|nr:right-handed parallel beta-helix repeat-containing protein [Verrucomicrobiota bacterium JB023]